ncbi:mucin [Ophiocordyceps camponoti-floridani]|uniref:Mucin n=1 Tax=Ophiocordyceps camponoti-floridani TaxID=2030778 RepID=A0A8H4VGU6_9HYPO|nr:mucin [Ophiocordyceps camponoti-floridani]
MPYNTRRKSLSLTSLGIHIPVTNAARKKQASASPPVLVRREPDSHPSKRFKRSHDERSTPPPSPPPSQRPKIDLQGINDDIVEASILQLQSTANRPHLIKELATVLSQKLSSVQQSANPCAIISSRLASYMKRPCWSAIAPCPIAKELETLHPRRTYFYLTTYPRQPLPDPTIAHTVVTPSVSLTDDSGSDDVEARRRDLSPSPEVDLSSPEFDDADDDFVMPMTPVGSYKPRYLRLSRDMRHDSPPLEKDEREFTQTADVLQKRKLNDHVPVSDPVSDRAEYGYRDDMWFGESRFFAPAAFITSPTMRPSLLSTSRKDDDADPWTKLNKVFECDQGAESIEIDELDCLLEGC